MERHASMEYSWVARTCSFTNSEGDRNSICRRGSRKYIRKQFAARSKSDGGAVARFEQIPYSGVILKDFSPEGSRAPVQLPDLCYSRVFFLISMERRKRRGNNKGPAIVLVREILRD